MTAKPDGAAPTVNAALVHGQAEGEGRPKGGPAKRDAVTSEARRHRHRVLTWGDLSGVAMVAEPRIQNGRNWTTRPWRGGGLLPTTSEQAANGAAP